MLGLGLFLSWGSSLLGVHGLLVVVSPVAEYRPSSGHASVVVAPGLEGTDSVIMGLVVSRHVGSSPIREGNRISCVGRHIFYP